MNIPFRNWPPERQTVFLNALLRELLCISPLRSEVLHWQSTHLPPVDRTWIELRHGQHRGWMYVDLSDGSGVYRATPPPGVDPAEMVVFEIPPGRFHELRDRFSESLRLLPASSRSAQWPALAQSLDEMGNGAFEMREVSRFQAGCTGNQGNLAGFLGPYRADLLEGHAQCRYPGYFVGLMTLVLGSWTGFEEPCVQKLTRSPTAIHDLNSLVRVLLDEVFSINVEAIGSTVQSLFEEGLALVEQAKGITEDEPFYGKLFQSCACFFGAKSGGEFLAARLGSDHRDWRTFFGIRNACEESMVVAATSLYHRFENLYLNWDGFRYKQSLVQRLVTEGQAVKADGLAGRMIATECLYPSSYRQLLLENRPPPAIPPTGLAMVGNLIASPASVEPPS